jgi:rod shape-determining protein MreC
VAFRDGPFENLKVPLAWTAAVAVLVCGIGAALLLLSDHRSSSPYDPVRAGAETAAAPVGGVLAAPVRWFGHLADGVGGYFFAVSENRRLKARIAELEGWRDEAIALKNINARYEAMLGVRPQPPVPMATANSVTDSRGPFSNARVLDSGATRGIKVGNPVINEHGLVGRIVGVAGNASRMLLLTDVASRTPVLIDRTDARAILVGDGSGNPRLEFVRGSDAIQPGDRILTSGDGGAFPRGLPVGVAAKGIDGSWRAKLYSDRGAVDLVRILLFEDFAQLTNPEALNAPPLAAFETLPQATPEQVAAIEDAAVRRAAAGNGSATSRPSAGAAGRGGG